MIVGSILASYYDWAGSNLGHHTGCPYRYFVVFLSFSVTLSRDFLNLVASAILLHYSKLTVYINSVGYALCYYHNHNYTAKYLDRYVNPFRQQLAE